MTKNKLNTIITDNYQYIVDKVEQISNASPYPIVKNNCCNDVISEMFIILSKQRNLNKMKSETDVRGMINNTLVLLLRKSGSSYIKEIQQSTKYHTNIEEDNTIYIQEDDYQNDEYIIKTQSFEYAIQCWNVLGKKSDKRLYELYFIEGYDSVRKLADRLEISNYAAHKMIKEMKNIITDITLGMDYEDAIIKHKNK